MFLRRLFCLSLPALLGLAAVAWLLAALAPQPAQAAGQVGLGFAASCTEDALNDALDGGGLVTFNCGPEHVTITLTARRSLTADTTLDGGGKVTLRGAGPNGVFAISDTATVRLYGLVFYGSASQGNGGAIHNSGTLVVSATTFLSNTAFVGGAIYSAGALTITDSGFYSNTAQSNGGALYTEGLSQLVSPTAYIAGSTFAGNQTDANGGAIFARDALTLVNSSVFANIAQSNGGGVHSTGANAYLDNVDLYDNAALHGGGFSSVNGETTLEAVRVFDNRASGSAGGLYLSGGTAVVRRVQVYGNEARTSGGGVVSQVDAAWDDVDLHHNTVTALGSPGIGLGGGVYVGGGAQAFNNTRVYANVVVSGTRPGLANAGGGGGVAVSAAELRLTNSAVFSNSVLHGLGGGGLMLHVAQVVISNTAIYSNAVPEGQGGGLELSSGMADMTLINATVSGNTAQAGGAIYNRPGNPALVVTNATIVSNTSGAGGVLTGAITLKNSLVAFNAPANCGEGVTSAGHNLESANTCGLAAAGDAPNTNPLIAPLAANGAANPANLTHALLEGSPAIDTAGGTACPATDQRGGVRPLDGDGDSTPDCDKGAYEFGNLLRQLFLAFIRR